MRYMKLIAPVIGVLLTALASAFMDGHVSAVEGVQILIAATQAAGVALAGLVPIGLMWPKTVVAGVLAGLQLLATYLINGGNFGAITLTEWINIGLAIAVALGVAAIPQPAVGPPAPPAQPV